MTSSDRPAWDPMSEAATRYTTALLEASGRVPEHQVDWDGFHVRLAARAELALARLRHPHVTRRAPLPAERERRPDQPQPLAWWEHAARWSRAIVTASVAAGIALIMVVRASPKETPEAVAVTTIAAATDAPRAAFESAVIGRTSASSMRAALLPSAADLLIPLGGGGQR
jgi:hypothetical protein